MNICNVLVVTHNSRLRNLIRILYPKLSSSKLPRFKNCAVLHLQLNTPDHTNIIDTFTLKLIYAGEIDNKKDRIYFEENNFNVIIQPNANLVPFNIRSSDKIINIFLVRHGEGEHNITKGFFNKEIIKRNMIKDALLTPKGVRQAKNAGVALFNYLNKIKQLKIEYTFCSKLRRSYYTATRILYVLSFDRGMINPTQNQLQNIEITTNNIIVLPCSHEIGNDKQGLLSGFVNIFEVNENTSLCVNKRNRSNHNICPKEEEKPKHMVTNNTSYDVPLKPLKYYTINWDYYDKTFPSWYSSQTLKCTKDNNMISYIIRYINNRKF